MAALNTGQFKGPLFHGTVHDIAGDVVPRNAGIHSNTMWGDTGYAGQKSSDHAFASEKENVAWRFANASGISARWSAQREREDGREAAEPPREKVYEVARHPQMTKGVYHRDHPAYQANRDGDNAEWRAPAFRVKNRIDTMPGRQGTFPQLNWNQFRGKEATPGMEANHPSDEDIRIGHEPRINTDTWRRFIDKRDSTDVEEHPPTVSHDQMDLFSGRTAEDHAENDESDVGEYHRRALFGHL